MIKVNKVEAIFMLENLDLHAHLTQAVQLSLNSEVPIEEDIADELRELCLERFDEVGLDEHYKPTQIGRELNALIDKLYIG